MSHVILAGAQYSLHDSDHTLTDHRCSLWQIDILTLLPWARTQPAMSRSLRDPVTPSLIHPTIPRLCTKWISRCLLNLGIYRYATSIRTKWPNWSRSMTTCFPSLHPRASLLSWPRSYWGGYIPEKRLKKLGEFPRPLNYPFIWLSPTIPSSIYSQVVWAAVPRSTSLACKDLGWCTFAI